MSPESLMGEWCQGLKVPRHKRQGLKVPRRERHKGGAPIGLGTVFTGRQLAQCPELRTLGLKAPGGSIASL